MVDMEISWSTVAATFELTIDFVGSLVCRVMKVGRLGSDLDRRT
jgi:hypothetical protein